MKGLKPYFEEFHKLKYTNEAIKASVELSAKYIHDRKLPDKAIDVIDETGASQMLVPEKQAQEEDHGEGDRGHGRHHGAHSAQDGLQVRRRRHVNLEKDLKRLVFGQDQAIAALASAIKLARAGLREPEKPIGSYLFSGPTGVGKTEVAKQLAA